MFNAIPPTNGALLSKEEWKIRYFCSIAGTDSRTNFQNTTIIRRFKYYLFCLSVYAPHANILQVGQVAIVNGSENLYPS